jgi:hypothetical protein
VEINLILSSDEMATEEFSTGFKENRLRESRFCVYIAHSLEFTIITLKVPLSVLSLKESSHLLILHSTFLRPNGLCFEILFGILYGSISRYARKLSFFSHSIFSRSLLIVTVRA